MGRKLLVGAPSHCQGGRLQRFEGPRRAFSAEEAEKVRKGAVAPLQDAWIKRASAEAKVDGRKMLDEFLGYVREFEKTSTYVPGFERYLQKCGKS